MVLTAIAAIGTQSRGALLGMAAMGVMLWLKSKQKFLIALARGRFSVRNRPDHA